jgi:hypothetical protein
MCISTYSLRNGIDLYSHLKRVWITPSITIRSSAVEVCGGLFNRKNIVANISTKTPSHIDPNCLYSLRGFQAASGISATRMREARNAGISPKFLEVGRRKFLRGSDAIEYLERLSRLDETA